MDIFFIFLQSSSTENGTFFVAAFVVETTKFKKISFVNAIISYLPGNRTFPNPSKIYLFCLRSLKFKSILTVCKVSVVIVSVNLENVLFGSSFFNLSVMYKPYFRVLLI